MKIRQMVIGLSLALTAALTPVQKADACLFLVTPLTFVIGAGLSAGTLVPYLVDYDGTIKSNYDRYSNELFLGLISIALLDQDQDKLDEALTDGFPEIPSYIVVGVSEVLREKAKHMEFDAHGVKALTLTEEEFSDFELAMIGEVAPGKIEAFKRLLTTR